MPERKQDRWAKKARKTHERLRQRDMQSSGITPKPTQNIRTEAQNSRLKFLALLGVGGGLVVVGGVSLKQLVTEEYITSPEPTTTSTLVQPHITWERLSSASRIKLLEAKDYPSISNFYPDKELYRATAEYYCQEAICRGDPLEMAQKVSIVNSARIQEEVERENGRKLTEEEKKKYVDGTVETVPLKNKAVLFHDVVLDRVANKIRGRSQVMTELGNLDLMTVLKTSLLFHGYSHYNCTTESFEIIPIVLADRSGNVLSTINRIRGFTFEGINFRGQPIFHSGGTEALTEYNGVLVGQEIGPYLSPDEYSSGFAIVDQLNLASKLNPMVFKEIYAGKRPIKELLNYWGSLKNPNNPDHNAALQVLLRISFRVKESTLYTQEETLQEIEDILKPN